MLAIATTMLVAGVSAQCRLKHITEWIEQSPGLFNEATSASPSNDPVVTPKPNDPAPTARTTRNTLFDACSRHFDCNAQQYCTTQRQCLTLSGCFISDDPIDQFCPGDNTRRTPHDFPAFPSGFPSDFPAFPSGFPSDFPDFPSNFPDFPSNFPDFPSDFGGRRRLLQLEEHIHLLDSQCVPCVEQCGEKVKNMDEPDDAFSDCYYECTEKDFEHSLATCTLAEAWVPLKFEGNKVRAEVDELEDVPCATCRDQCIENVEAYETDDAQADFEKIAASFNECLACCSGRFMETFTDCSSHVEGLPAWNDDIDWTVDVHGASTGVGVIVGVIFAVLFGLSCLSCIICLLCPCICAGAIAMKAAEGPKGGNPQGVVHGAGTTPGPQHV